MWVDHLGALHFCSTGEFAVLLVTRQVEQQKGCEQSAGGVHGGLLGASYAERAQEATTLDDSVRRPFGQASERRRACQRPCKREGVVVERVGERWIAENETRNRQGCRGVLGAGGRRCRVQRGDRFYVGTGSGFEYGDARTHPVACYRQFVRMNADVAGAESDAGDDVEGCAEIGSEAAM